MIKFQLFIFVTIFAAIVDHSRSRSRNIYLHFSHFQITYHELEAFNGDSSSISVEDTFFSMDNLQPGRNYSIGVQAVSNGIESLQRTVFQATSELFLQVNVWVGSFSASPETLTHSFLQGTFWPPN